MSAASFGTNSRAFGFFLLAALLTAAWLALNFAFPDLGTTGFPIGFTFLITNGIILIGLWLGLTRTNFQARTRTTVWLTIAVPFTLWAVLMWFLAVNGVFRRTLGPVPILPFAIFVPILVGIPLLTRSSYVASLLDAMPSSWLIGLQVYRVLGGIFVVNWARDAMPGVFAVPAGFGDVLVGLLALPAALWVSQGSRSGRIAGVLWNLLGITDLAIAVCMGMLSSPGPFHVFALEHPNTLIGSFPIVMIPAFAVPNSIILHGLSLWQLRRMGKTAINKGTHQPPEFGADLAQRTSSTKSIAEPLSSLQF